MNEELQKVQQFAMRLTKWLNDSFGVKLLKSMPNKEIETRLSTITKRLNDKPKPIEPAGTPVLSEPQQQTTNSTIVRHSKFKSQSEFRVPHFGVKTEP